MKTATNDTLELLASAERAIEQSDLKTATDAAQTLETKVVRPNGMAIDDLRRLAQVWERLGRIREARRAWLAVARVDRRYATIRSVERRLESLVDPDTSDLRSIRICLLTSFTVAPLRSFLAVACAAAGLKVEIATFEFRAIERVARDSSSALYAFSPDLVVLAVDLDDAIPDWILIPFDENVRDHAHAATNGILDLATSIVHNRPEALLAVHTLRLPRTSPLGSFDITAEHGVRPFLQQLNASLAVSLKSLSALPVDFDALVASSGGDAIDVKFRLLSGCPYSDALLHVAARRLLGPLMVRAGRAAKVLVLDLDNTLWGGVLGELGIEGIELGPAAPGSAFLGFQRVLDALSRRGMLLAICSKNDEADARSCLRKHPHMLLREDRFAAFRIGWQDKPQSLREMAQELSLGLSSFVFVDDNPVERARMRAELPEVLTVELPPEPALYAQILLDQPELDILELTKEDRDRTRTYVARRQVQDLRKKFETPEEFFESLSLFATIATMKAGAVARVAQLLQKTNQWNLTMSRHDVPEVRTWVGDPSRQVYTLTLEDRFADHGLVAAAVVDGASDEWNVLNMVMSCRVIGLNAETSLLATLVDDARAAGARTIKGSLLYAPRNEPARDFFQRHGFALVEKSATGELWRLDLSERTVTAPSYVRISRVES